MEIRHNKSGLAIPALMVILALVAPVVPVAGDGSGTYPVPPNGDWVIENATRAANETILIDGNISVGHGSLTLENAVISGNKAARSFFIEVSENGTLNAVNCTFKSGISTDMVLRLRGLATFRNCNFVAQSGPIWIYRYTGSVSIIDSVLEGTFEVKVGNTPTLQNVTIKNAYFGVMNPYPVSGLTFINCTLGMFAGSNNTVTDCDFIDCEKGVAPGPGTVVRGCDFTGCDIGVSSSLEGNVFRGPRILSCNFTNCLYGALLGDGFVLDGCNFTGCDAGVSLLAGGNVTTSRFLNCGKGVELRTNSSGNLSGLNFGGSGDGVMAAEMSSAVITGCTFVRPDAGNAGNASVVSGGNLMISGSDFGGNSGKDIRIQSGNCSLFNTTIRGGSYQVLNGFLSVYWYLDCTVKFANSTPAAGATVTVSDPANVTLVTALTDSAGNTGALGVMEYRVTPAGVYYRTPLSVNASFGIYAGTTTTVFGANRHLDLTLSDISVPRIQILAPANGSLLNITNIVLTGTAGDDAGPLGDVSVRVDLGTWTAATGSSSWTAAVTLSDGVHLIEARATDTALNIATAQISLTIDTIAPLLNVTSPLQGAVFNDTHTKVAGTTEPGATLTINGETVANLNGSFSLNYSLLEGRNDIVVVSTDPAGNRHTYLSVVTLDTTPPPLAITSPSDGAVSINRTVTITGTSENGTLLGLGTKTLTVNGTSFSVQYNLTEGANTLVLYARDAAGNKRNQTLRLVLDTTPPGLVLDTNIPSTTTIATVNITGTTEANATLTVNGNPARYDSTGRFNVSVTLALGLNNITVAATDSAGNCRNQTLVITRQSTPPPPPPPPKPPVDTVNYTPIIAIAGILVVVGAVVGVMMMRRKPQAPHPATSQAPATPGLCPFCGAPAGPSDDRCLNCAAALKPR